MVHRAGDASEVGRLLTHACGPDGPPLSSDPDLDDLEAIVSTLLATGALKDVLHVIRSDRAEAAAVAGRSCRHPLGFAKLPLGPLPGSAVRLRLHVWADAGPSSPVPPDEPHAHRWRFASTIAWGGPLQVVHFREVADSDGFHRFEYGPSRVAMAASGRRGLRVMDEMHRYRGDVYRCERGTVHTIRPVDSDVVTTTLIAQGPDVDVSTPVYRRDPNPAINGRREMDADAVVRLVERVLEAT